MFNDFDLDGNNNQNENPSDTNEWLLSSFASVFQDPVDHNVLPLPLSSNTESSNIMNIQPTPSHLPKSSTDNSPNQFGLSQETAGPSRGRLPEPASNSATRNADNTVVPMRSFNSSARSSRTPMSSLLSPLANPPDCFPTSSPKVPQECSSSPISSGRPSAASSIRASGLQYNQSNRVKQHLCTNQEKTIAAVRKDPKYTDEIFHLVDPVSPTFSQANSSSIEIEDFPSAKPSSRDSQHESMKSLKPVAPKGFLNPPTASLDASHSNSNLEEIASSSNASENLNTSSRPFAMEDSESLLPGRPIVPLLKPIDVSYLASAHQLLESCRELEAQGKAAVHHLDTCPPPSIPIRLKKNISKDDLRPATPVVVLKTKEEAVGAALFRACMDPKNPFLLIKRISPLLDIDLSVFSSKTISKTNPKGEIDTRNQEFHTSSETWDRSLMAKTWKWVSSYGSKRNTLGGYFSYQSKQLKELVNEAKQRDSQSSETKGNKKMTKKMHRERIKFATNIDLKDPETWKLQMNELKKLPWWFQISSNGNMLRYFKENILGINTPQMYMKVPGCRTSGHQENNNCSGVNINIGPGVCEWFAIPEQHWGEVQALCKMKDVAYMSGSWWPVLEDLEWANIPYYNFMQRPGELVWLNAGTVHWVRSVGFTNNVSWNIAILTPYQYQIAFERYEWNKHKGIRSLLQLQRMTWKVAEEVAITDKKLFCLMKTVLMRSLWYFRKALDKAEADGMECVEHGIADASCAKCNIELFPLIYTTTWKSEDKEYKTFCHSCAKKKFANTNEYGALLQCKIEKLMDIYDQFVLETTKRSSKENDSMRL